MRLSDGLPAAPPVDPRSYPPRSRLSWWLWAGLLLAVLFLGLTVWGLARFAGHDHDRLDLIDSTDVTDAIAAPCRELAEAARDHPVAGTASERASALATITETARAIPAAVTSLAPDILSEDRPAEAWARDWTRLLDVVDAHVTRLRAGDTTAFDTPQTRDGFSIIGRMDIASEAVCAVPDSLVTLDPSPPPIPLL